MNTTTRLALVAALAIGANAFADTASDLLSAIRGIRSSQNQVAAELDVNLSRKRANEARFAALDSEAESYRAQVNADTVYCSGTYEEPEYARRVAECRIKQQELDRWSDRLQASYAEVEEAEADRVSEAEALFVRHQILEARLAEALRRLQEISDASCDENDDLEDAWHCLCQEWDGCS